MKILGYVLALLFLLVTAFVQLAGANKAHKFAGDVAEVMKMTDGLNDAQKKEMEAEMEKQGGIPSGGRLNGGAVVGGLGGLAALVLLIAAFAKKQWVTGLAAVTVGATALSAAIYPHVETGLRDGAAPRSLAMVAIILAAIGAGGALLASKRAA